MTTAKKNNQSLRLLYLNGGRLDVLFYGAAELNRQMAEGKQENLARLFGPVDECPCRCGLKHAVCDEHYQKVLAANDEIPF